MKESGYEVDLLVGMQATQGNIRKKLDSFSEKGRNKGVVLVGLFGHGVEFDSTKKSYFCPFDTSLKAKRDSKGNLLSDDEGRPRMEPREEKLISIDEILVALRESKASNRILLADCCRNDPNAARGRSFGTSLGTNQLPEDTAVFFACKSQEKAFEHPDWEHGPFTKCLLDSLRTNASQGKSLMGLIAADVETAVEELVKSKVNATQTPRLLSTGARVDLQLKALSTTKTNSPLAKPEVLPPTPKSAPPNQPTKPQETTSRGFEGTKAGDAKDLVPGIVFHWCPPGAFTMGTPEATNGESPANVTLTKGFWLGETEVTEGQWRKLLGTVMKKGDDFPVTDVSHDEAVSYCQKLTTQERASGLLPKGWKFSLPTEAQWEYACRAETKTMYSFGDSESQLGDYAWFDENSSGGVNRVGKKKANDWGLKDMHGNVWEWCSDWDDKKLIGGRDPVGPSSGSYREYRGGCWFNLAVYFRSADRGCYSPDVRRNSLGFRLAAVPGE